MTVMVMIVLFIIAGIVFFIHEKQFKRCRKLSQKLRRIVKRMSVLSVSAGLVPKTKIALAFTQVIAALESTYAIGMPDMWFEW